MRHTLPLFDGLEPPPESTRCGPPADARPAPAGPPERPASVAGASQERHLRAAWRLSRGMWRYPDHSPEQTRAGLAICHHLQALLAQSQGEPPARSD